jgi:nitrile hydratase
MSARFRVGDPVSVRMAHSHGHVRTPHYVKGKRGVIERICGEFRNPEELAYARDGLPKRPLYRVRFEQTHVWPGYTGAPGDTVEVEIFEHWLRPGNDTEA